MTMTAVMNFEEATAFSEKSDASALKLSQIAAERGCSCQPYVDWFTFHRWLAQGLVVKKGEHGIKLWGLRDDTDKSGKVTKKPRVAAVFCRCQVHPVGEAQVAPVPEVEPIVRGPFIFEV